MEKSSVFEQHKQFKEGHKNVEDDEKSSYLRFHRTIENAEKMWNLVHSYRCLISIRAVAVQLNLGKETDKF
jgi:hypothetical protein